MEKYNKNKFKIKKLKMLLKCIFYIAISINVHKYITEIEIMK